MDAHRYPRLSRYLRMLPDELRSYPECESKASVYLELSSRLPPGTDFDGLDPAIRAYVESPPTPTTWVPSVVLCSVILAIADRAFPSEDAFVRFIDDFTERLFRTPAYRMLMIVASPARFAESASRRWRAFHVGSNYEVKIHANGSDSRVTYPPFLLDRFMLRANSRVVRAAMRASGAPQAEVDLVEWTPTQTTFKAVWFPK